MARYLTIEFSLYKIKITFIHCNPDYINRIIAME